MNKFGRHPVGSAKIGRSGMDDLLSSVDCGTNDDDWLLTLPETPLFPSSDASESQPTASDSRKSSSVRSVSTTKASRLSVAQSENNYSSRQTRSSSVTRPSNSTVNYNTYSSNRSSSILNTSSGSVTSIPRPSTPGARGSVSSRPSTPGARGSVSSRPATPTGRSIPSRTLTPAKSRSATTITSGDKTRAPQITRPSTPTSRPQSHANLNFPVVRSNSRPSTPTRRNPAPGPTPVVGRSASVGRALTNGRNVAAPSRGSSPGPQARSTQQLVLPLDYPHDTPPNLRTTLPDRPVSAGRSRPNAAPTVRGNSEATLSKNPPRRQSSSPVVTRGRLQEPSAKGRLHANGYNMSATYSHKASPVLEPAVRRSSKPTTTAVESTGFGRSISKKSLDMALRHMDIRHSSGSSRPLSGATLFPQSVRSGASKGQRARVSDPPLASISTNGMERPPTHGNSTNHVNGNYNHDRSQDGEMTEESSRQIFSKVSEPDIYESSRYDTILLKEDLKNTNWLHSMDDRADMGLLFDHRFELLPEPFDPL